MDRRDIKTKYILRMMGFMKESVYQQPIEVSSGQETVINKKFNFTSIL